MDTEYYCVVINCAIDRPIIYDNEQNIITAVVDYCFDNLNNLRTFLGERWYDGLFSDTLCENDIIEKNKHIEELITQMNEQCNKLIKSEKLSANDYCCYYQIFKTNDKTKIKSLTRYLKESRDKNKIQTYSKTDYDKVVKATKLMITERQKWKNIKLIKAEELNLLYQQFIEK